MGKRDDGGAVFPSGNVGQMGAERGMSLRDWFAGQALAGLVSGRTINDAKIVSEKAYRLADAMLAEREKAE